MKESLINVQDALALVLNHARAYGSEEIELGDSIGRVLDETILADRDFPAFNRVSMDGIAIQFQHLEGLEQCFPIEGVQAAGQPQMTLNHPKHCLEVMTGAVLPQNTDTVIPYEHLSLENGQARIKLLTVGAEQNVHRKGKDRKKGDQILEKGLRIGPAEIGVLATVGKSMVRVKKNPKVAIVSTGDELVPVDEKPEAHQIRRSNAHTLAALMDQWKVPRVLYHFNDDKVALTKSIARLLDEFDCLLFSGAVSKGKFDFLPEVLDELQVEKQFHRVAQRPGKPFWFGSHPQALVFAFPGNPVSTFVSCLKYFKPWLDKSMGNEARIMSAALSEDFNFKPSLSYFLQVSLSTEHGQLIASPQVGNGSGDLSNLTLADGFLELPADRESFKKGEIFPYLAYR